jgi:hypothetical protein
MVSTPKQTTSTSSVEPWSGSKEYLLDQYSKANDLFNSGAPKPYQGSTIANQSQATKDALSNTEALARNGDTSALTNATNAVNSVMTQNGNNQANQTLSQLQGNTSLGTNPAAAIAQQIGSGQTAQAPGQYNQNWQNPATAQAANAGQYTNGATSAAQNLANYNNSAIPQAANYGSYENAAGGLQAQQANTLASNGNPAMDYLKQTASGANIGKNPYLDSMVATQQGKISDQLRNITNPGIDSTAASLGRMGSAAYASQRNSADSTAASQMAKVATDMYGAQFNQDQQNQMAAAGQYGSMYNSDQQNQLNANANLAQTNQAQQQSRQAGTALYGDMQNQQNQQRLAGNQNWANQNDSQQQIRNAGTSMYGDLANSQQTQNQNANNSANAQFNANRDYQMAGLNLSNSAYQSNIANMLGLNDQRMNAANSQLSNQSNVNGQKLAAAGQAANAYQNQYLPSSQLAGVGAAKDDRASLELQAQVNAWDRNQQQPIQNISNFVNLLNGGGYNTTTSQTPVYSNTAGQVMGGLSSLAGLFALCDATTKILHKVVGEMPLTNGDTLNIYEFSYCDDPDQKIWVGPVAQSVEAANANAVVEFNGKKHIKIEELIRSAA